MYALTVSVRDPHNGQVFEHVFDFDSLEDGKTALAAIADVVAGEEPRKAAVHIKGKTASALFVTYLIISASLKSASAST